MQSLTEYKISKSFVRPDDTAVITCPHCNKQKTILANSYIGNKHKLKVKCLCRQRFVVFLEFRKHVRKKTVLQGTYLVHSPKHRSGNLIIQDISLGGFSFTSLDIEKFKVGEVFKVTFTLNDEYLTEIKKEIAVINFRQRIVGCKFKQPEDVYGGPLGYYIVNIL